MVTVTPSKCSWAKGDRLNPAVNAAFRTTARVLISICSYHYFSSIMFSSSSNTPFAINCYITTVVGISGEETGS